jgi:hypothetical protein
LTRSRSTRFESHTGLPLCFVVEFRAPGRDVRHGKPLDEPARLAALILDFLGERVVRSA